MLDTFIKNRGITKTIIHNNNKNQVNEVNWDIDYDGNEANVSLDLNNNGNLDHYKFNLDDRDLANILNIDGIKLDLGKRLKNDFLKKKYIRDPGVYSIYLDDFKPPPVMPIVPKYQEPTQMIELDPKPKNLNYIPTILPNEEFIVPLTISDNLIKSYVSPKSRGNRIRVPSLRKKYRRPKTHRTYKIYRYPRNSIARGVNKNKLTKRNYKNILKSIRSL